MRAPTLTARRPRLWAAAALLAVAGALLALQPLRSPWWTGFDFDSVYVASGLRLAAGERSAFYDHPGAPLQEALAASFTAARALSGEDRGKRADEWLSNLDSTRPYLRTWGSLLYLVSALAVFLTVAWVMRHAVWGLLAGLLFLGAPDMIAWAAVVKPDPLLAALSVVSVGLAVEGFRRRSAALYLASAFAAGFNLSVKVHAVGLLLPLALAVLFRPPPSGWWADVCAAASAWWRAHRPAVVAGAGVWLALVLALNLTAASPSLDYLVEVALALAAAALLGALVWLAARRTRAAAHTSISLGLAGFALAGAVLPNLLYASVPAPMLQWLAITATGGGVNRGARPALSPLDVLEPWTLTLLVALLGAVVALRDRDGATLLWLAGAFSMGLLAYLRFGELHYYAPTIALLAPLVLRALAAFSPQPGAVAVLVVAALLYSPYKLGIDSARDRGEIAERTERVNSWVERRLGPDEVALTRLESDDGRFFYLVRLYAPDGHEPSYRFLPPSPEAARYVERRGLRVGYVVTGSPEDVDGLLASLGLPGRARRVDAPGFVYRVEPEELARWLSRRRGRSDVAMANVLGTVVHFVPSTRV